jgi:hypothetical protein
MTHLDDLIQEGVTITVAMASLHACEDFATEADQRRHRTLDAQI